MFFVPVLKNGESRGGCPITTDIYLTPFTGNAIDRLSQVAMAVQNSNV
jgi:hypothetical protein